MSETTHAKPHGILRRVPRHRLAISLALALAVAVAVAVLVLRPAYQRWRNPWPELVEAIERFSPQRNDYDRIYSERHGSPCLTQGCAKPRLERVYLTELSPAAACDDILKRFKKIRQESGELDDLRILTGDDVDPGEECYADGGIDDGHFVTALVRVSDTQYPGHGVPADRTVLALNVFD